jgi:predicted methyltransferase
MRSNLSRSALSLVPVCLLAAAAVVAVACGPSPGMVAAEPPPPASSAAPAPVPPPVESAPPPAASASAATAGPPAEYVAVVAAADRSADDKALDAGRKPAEFLAFVGVKPGARVAEIAAGGGYTTELLARAVGLTGTVYSTNNKFIVEKFAQKPWTARLALPANRKVVRVEREFDDPLPKEATNLDAVVNVLFYHDTVWMKTNRDQMNKKIYDALKPGGVYVILDHNGKDGSGTADVKTLHRIEEKVVRDEVLKAGFKLGEESTAWRNPSDTRDWNDAPSAAADKRGTSDRFALKFVKPLA